MRAWGQKQLLRTRVGVSRGDGDVDVDLAHAARHEEVGHAPRHALQLRVVRGESAGVHRDADVEGRAVVLDPAGLRAHLCPRGFLLSKFENEKT